MQDKKYNEYTVILDKEGKIVEKRPTARGIVMITDRDAEINNLQTKFNKLHYELAEEKPKAGRPAKAEQTMIKNLNELAKFVKGGADVLQKAIDSKEETTIEFIEGSFVSETELEELKTKVRNDGKKEGQTIGYDFAMKDIKKDFGIEIEGKDRETIVKTVKETILSTAKIEPNKKITELEQSVEKLRKQYDEDIAAKDSEINKYKGNLKSVSVISELQKNAPEVKGINLNQFLTLVKTEYDFDFDEQQNVIALKNGQPVKDKMERPIPVKNILTDFATQNGWFGTPGRGGGNEHGSPQEFKTLNDVYAHMEKNKIDPLSPEGEKLVNNFKSN